MIWAILLDLLDLSLEEQDQTFDVGPWIAGHRSVIAVAMDHT